MKTIGSIGLGAMGGSYAKFLMKIITLFMGLIQILKMQKHLNL